MAKLSAVVNFYDEFAFVADSVRSAMSQPGLDLELILVNDNPTLETSSFLGNIFDQLPVNVISTPANIGLSQARNAGLDAASGDYVVFLDGDDFFLPGGLTETVALAEQTGAEMVHGQFVHAPAQAGFSPKVEFVSNGLDKSYFSKVQDLKSLWSFPELQMIVTPWKFLMKRDYLVRNKIGFEPDLRKFEDRPFVLSLLLAGGQIAFYPKPYRAWRHRPGSISSMAKSDDEIGLMMVSVLRCFEVIDRFETNGKNVSGVRQRELAHALARVSTATPILRRALREDSFATELRSELSALFKSAAVPAFSAGDAFLRAKVAGIAPVLADNRGGIDSVLRLWHALANGDWGQVSRLVKVENLFGGADQASPAS
ncbi:MAG: glycosyltransferase family 2 protein [Hyphomicrobiaceae bacterium]|nr:glycosyltransferase family 2 protein [Hyphomicrobiaceae bacterium]